MIAASLPFIRMGFLDEEGSHLPPAPLRESKAAPKDTADDIIVPIDEVEDGLDHEHVNDGFLRQFMKQADQCRSPAEYSDEECSPSTTSAEPAGPRVIFVLLNWRTIHAALVRSLAPRSFKFRERFAAWVRVVAPAGYSLRTMLRDVAPSPPPPGR